MDQCLYSDHVRYSWRSYRYRASGTRDNGLANARVLESVVIRNPRSAIRPDMPRHSISLFYIGFLCDV